MLNSPNCRLRSQAMQRHTHTSYQGQCQLRPQARGMRCAGSPHLGGLCCPVETQSVEKNGQGRRMRAWILALSSQVTGYVPQNKVIVCATWEALGATDYR